MQRPGCPPIPRARRDEGTFPIPSPGFCLVAGLLALIAAAVSSTNRGETTPEGIITHASRIDDVAFSPGGRMVGSASSDGTLKIRESATGRQKTVAVSGINGFSGVAFSPDGRTLASSTLDGRIFFVDLEGCQGVRSFPASETQGAVRDVAFAPDGRSLASAGDDRAIHLWDVPTGRARLTLRGHEATVTGLAYAPDGQTICSASLDGRAITWEARTGRVKDRVEAGLGPLWAVAISSDGRRVAVGGRDGILIRDLEGGRSTTFRSPGSLVASLDFFPCGTVLASAGLEGTLSLWKVGEAELRPWRTLEGRVGPVKALAVTPDGRSLVAGGNDAILRLWRLQPAVLLQAKHGR